MLNKEVSSVEQMRKDAAKRLPEHLNRVVGGYELRVYWCVALPFTALPLISSPLPLKLTCLVRSRQCRFEIFECVRKLSLVGLPVFFMPDSLEQLVFGLIICFLSFGMYTWYKPYRDSKDDSLQKLCQIQVFFALLSKIILDHPGVTGAQTSTMGYLLVFTSVLPPIIGVLMDAPLSSFVPHDAKHTCGRILNKLRRSRPLLRDLQESENPRALHAPSTDCARSHLGHSKGVSGVCRSNNVSMDESSAAGAGGHKEDEYRRSSMTSSHI